MIDHNPDRISSNHIELGSGPVGCFLIHGFTGSTYEMEGLANFLAHRGLRVNARLLPGHGTSIADCNRTRAEDWLTDTEYHLTEFLLDCEKVVVIGQSMGANLALHLASVFPVTAVVAVSTALNTRKPLMHRLLPIITPFVDQISKARVYAAEDDGLRTYGYEAYPIRAFRELIRLNKHILPELGKIDKPALILHSKADASAPFENAALVSARIKSTDQTTIAYEKSSHILLDDCERDQVWLDIYNFVERMTSESMNEIPVH